MAEWSIAHAWKSDLFTHSDAQQRLPTQVPSTTSRNNDVHRRVLVNHRVDRGFEGVCDTVLTQNSNALSTLRADVYLYAVGCEVLRCYSGLLNRRVRFPVSIFELPVEIHLIAR